MPNPGKTRCLTGANVWSDFWSVHSKNVTQALDECRRGVRLLLFGHTDGTVLNARPVYHYNQS